MNHVTNKPALPSLIGNVLSRKHHYIDNLFAHPRKALRIDTLVNAAGFSKRSGMQISHVVFLLLLWKWLNVSSIALFSREALGCFSSANKDVMFDLLKREDINWRSFNLQGARAVYRASALQESRLKTYVLDDSIKTRRSKKMEGVSSHFDHVTNRHVMGQQVLTLGLATEEPILPIDSQIYVSQTKAKGLTHPFKDGRSIAAKRYQEATEQSKPEMAANMMKRAQRMGLDADYVVADAWFGTKPMIRAAQDLGICPILRMKKNKMKYRVRIDDQQPVLLDAKALYKQLVKGDWKKVKGLPWKAVVIEAELDLAGPGKKEPARQKVKLLFVRGQGNWRIGKPAA